MGLEPPELEGAQVLEIGCEDGAGLLSMAEACPDTAFLGLDVSSVSVAEARRRATALGLTNVQFDCKEPNALLCKATQGNFDFIICADDLARKSFAERSALLRFCDERLVPNGIAFVQYSALPGSATAAIVNEFARFVGRDYALPVERAEKARAMLGFVREGMSDSSGDYARQFREEASRWVTAGQEGPVAKRLSTSFEPLYFHQVEAEANAQGLRQLADARLGSWSSVQPSELRHLLERASPEPLVREQLLDFLRNRRFRRSVLVSSGLKVSGEPQFHRVERLRACAAVLPLDGDWEVSNPIACQVQSPSDGRVRTVSFPYLKALLLALAPEWPRSIPVATAIDTARARLQAGGLLVPETKSEAWHSLIVQACAAGLATLHTGRWADGGFFDQETRTPTKNLAIKAAEALLLEARPNAVSLEAVDCGFLSQLGDLKDRPALIE
jgi:2-polyprenyl-3-methyl-5-hydroxy-6-metoxy-1,4-benzoquinol methylase